MTLIFRGTKLIHVVLVLQYLSTMRRLQMPSEVFLDLYRTRQLYFIIFYFTISFYVFIEYKLPSWSH